MKKILFLLLISIQSFGQTFNTDTTMSGTYNAGGKIMFINAKISGNVTLTNCIIDANPFIQIFDTTVIIGANVKCERFSAMWYGANPANIDNSVQLQRVIEASKERSYPVYLPGGSYKTSQPLIVSHPIGGGLFAQTSIRIYGDASFWDNGAGSEIVYSGDSCALGLQLNKGSEISHIILTGKWVSPGGTDSAYYNTPLSSYINQSAHGNGEGLWIDPVGNWNQRSGSTGCYYHDLKIQGFRLCIEVSNPISQNGDIQLFERVQVGNSQIGVYTNQPQEKANQIHGIYSWGSVHTLTFINNGNYIIDGGNVAGRCIRLFNISSQSWFPSHISNFYAENIGSVGSFYSYLPINISNSVFDFISQTKVGALPLITSNSNLVKFSNSQFRYYGESSNLNFAGPATYDNCLFSGNFVGGAGSIRTSYNNSTINYNGSQIIQNTDATLSIPVKISLRSSH